jgi:hypothetical protein
MDKKMNIEEGFLPGFEPEGDKKKVVIENNLPKSTGGVEVKYATAEERIRCQYCEDVGICDKCERGMAESARLLDLKRQG